MRDQKQLLTIAACMAAGPLAAFVPDAACLLGVGACLLVCLAVGCAEGLESIRINTRDCRAREAEWSVAGYEPTLEDLNAKVAMYEAWGLSIDRRSGQYAREFAKALPLLVAGEAVVGFCCGGLTGALAAPLAALLCLSSYAAGMVTAQRHGRADMSQASTVR